MRDIQKREPRGLPELARVAHGRTGLVVHGWYNRLTGWPSARGWNAVTVAVDGRSCATLYQMNPGPTWIDLPCGAHDVEFLGGRNRVLHREPFVLSRGEALMITFTPRVRLPFRRAATPESWSRRTLW